MKTKIIIALIFVFELLYAQTKFTTIPEYPVETDSIVITFDVTYATHQNKIAGYTGDVYAHTGVTLKYQNGSISSWQNVIGTWGNNSVQPKLIRLGNNLYRITINNPRKFYNVTDPSFKIVQLCFVLRSSDGSKQTEDIFIPLYEKGVTVKLLNPEIEILFKEPLRSPYFIEKFDSVIISAKSITIGTKTREMKLEINNYNVLSTQQDSISFLFDSRNYPNSINHIKIFAVDTSGLVDSVYFVIMRNPEVKNLVMPQGLEHGINRVNSDVYLVLFAPYKKFVYVIGDFNDWKVDTNYFMNRYEIRPDSVLYWIKLNNLNENTEYAFQYLIDGSLRIPDPYSEKILDPWNDSSIPSNVYPFLKTYPYGKTENIVSVFKPKKDVYNWKVEKFNKPKKEDLIIYELLVRDFTSTHTFQTLIDTISYFKKLGINAIELMPVMEFEGNSSWGYNSMMHFAVDKYYGPSNKLKELIDSCHSNGIAVILDVVLNHVYGLNPLVRMYWDTLNARPAANNPWFNQVSPNPVYSWGYDFNHESKNTKYYVDRVTSYWLKEFKADGFRFDFTKGFTNTRGEGSQYDLSRIRILKRIADKVWSVDSNAYVILEHFTDDTEEKELTDYGMMVWGNLNYQYSQAAMGWNDRGKSEFKRISYREHLFDKPHLVGYMESHDEERLMYKNIKWGNALGSYDIKKTNIALSRMKLVNAFFLTIPGPKMIWQFGELGYDYSIDYNGRLGEKPIRWDYYTNQNFSERQKLFKFISELISLRKKYKVFNTTNFSLNTYPVVKRIDLYDSTMNVSIIGNFDVISRTNEFTFQNDGYWYEYFTNDSIKVENKKVSIELKPGEFRIYTSKKIPSPVNGKDLITSIDNNSTNINKDFSLSQNYPNPFNPTTFINYQIPSTSNVILKVYDILGREVTTLVNEVQQAGRYEIKFNASDLPSGVYFYRIQAGNFSDTKKMILLK
ncbi:alpha-amylase family glycosyl hydrolase [Rosettibacter firmus]|uniref:alpha-amylase family glycosyl hydrolase n=1 Tax=Rosettibacter firmus TaxID=3111522 RepID=UPI00336C26C4